MLTPNYLEQLPQPMIALVNELQEEIIAEVTKRIVKANVLTPSSEWLLYKANQLRLSSAAVNKIIAKNAKLRERTVRELYTEAVKLALNEDAKIYRYAISEGALDPMSGAKLTSFFKSVALNDTFKKGLAATNGLMRNLTNSMAAVSNRMLSDALDLAWLEVASGAFTPDEAVYKAIEKLAEKGLAVVEYKSGHKDQVDVAVRRAVRTGINKTCCDMQLDLANEMGSDLVEVSSHFGARPTHAEWQGQIYSLSGKHPKYKPFSVTGYGRGDGLGGWNCRHNFYPFFEGISIPASEPTFTEAKNLEYYKKTQKQRGYERAVRHSKRELAALNSARANTSDAALKAKLDKEFARKSSVLKKREKRLNDFCRDNGLLKDSSRTRVNGFGRSVSQKAVWADRKKSVQNITPKTLDKSGGSGIMDSVQKSDLGLFKNKLQSDNRITKEYYDCIKGKFSQGSDVGKKLFNKYVPTDSVENAAFEGTPQYNVDKKRIFMHFNTDLHNERGNGATWFHEHGHLIDDYAGRISNDSMFRRIIEEDVRQYRIKIGKENNLKTFDKIDKFISGELNNFRKHSAVSDIFEGATKGNIVGCGGHGQDYWQKDDKLLTSEAFAHMYEAQFDKTRYKEMQKYFPNSLRYIEKKMEDYTK